MAKQNKRDTKTKRDEKKTKENHNRLTTITPITAVVLLGEDITLMSAIIPIATD